MSETRARTANRRRDPRGGGRGAGLGTVAVMVLATVLLAQPAGAEPCTPLSHPAVVVFLLDTSLTVHYFQAFRQAWQSVISHSEDGDTIVLAVVKESAGGGSGGDFPYLERQDLPCYSVLETREAYQAKRAAVIKRLEQAFDEALKQRKGKQTLLLSSVRSAAKYFPNHGGPHLLVVASDGLEDSDTAKFDTMKFSVDASAKIIDRERTKELRDQMSHVSVYFVAAGSPSDERAKQVEQFWLSYFKAVGADLPPHRYAGSLINFQR